MPEDRSGVGSEPYQPPRRSRGPASGPRATFGQRLGAWLIDLIIVVIGGVVMGAIEMDALGALPGALYFMLLEGGAAGQTLGKRAVGIRVMDFTTGSAIGPGRALIRYSSQVLSGILLGLGHLWMLWDGEKRTWHDHIADSVVVPVSAYPVAR